MTEIRIDVGYKLAADALLGSKIVECRNADGAFKMLVLTLHGNSPHRAVEHEIHFRAVLLFSTLMGVNG